MTSLFLSSLPPCCVRGVVACEARETQEERGVVLISTTPLPHYHVHATISLSTTPLYHSTHSHTLPLPHIHFLTSPQRSLIACKLHCSVSSRMNGELLFNTKVCGKRVTQEGGIGRRNIQEREVRDGG